MSTTVATSRAYGAAVAENVVAALNSMGAQPQGCYGAQAPVPALALDFLTQSLDPRITFSRADATNCATRVNSAGLIGVVNTGLPRFDYDPVTLAPRGLLIEESRTNLLLRSNTFNTSWPTTRSSAATNTGATAPDGAASWNLIEDTTASNTHYTYQDVAKAASAIAYILTFYAKANGRNWLRFGFGNNTLSAYTLAYVDLSTGTIGNVTTSTFTSPVAPTATPVGNGWYRISIGATTDTDTVVKVLFAGATGDNGWSYNGTSTSYAYIYGAQLEAGSFPTSYIPTTTAAVTRAADVASMTGTAFSSWFNATEGTFVAGADSANNNGTFPSVFGVDAAGSASNRITNFVIVGATTSQMSTRIDSGGSNYMNSGSSTTFTNGAAAKMALGYVVNNCSNVTNGGAVNNDATVTLPVSIDVLRLGCSNSSAGQLNGHLQRITYYNERLPNATLKALSA